METKKKKAYLERIRCRLGFDNLFIVPRKNLSGGLALFWTNELDLHICTFSPHHIDAVVNPRVDDTWRFTSFYGAPEVANLEDSWIVLCHLRSQLSMPWVCIGDFNEIWRIQEKSRGCIWPESQMQGFRDCLKVCELKDLGFTGLPFTKCNRWYDGLVIWVRLDRAVALTGWMLKFPTAQLHHLSGSSSDHNSNQLCIDDAQRHFYRPNKPFKFKSMWLKDERFKGVVHSAWDMGLIGGPMENVLLKVSNCQSLLSIWNKKVFGNVRIYWIKKESSW